MHTSHKFIVPLTQIEYGVYEDLIVIYAKPGTKIRVPSLPLTRLWRSEHRARQFLVLERVVAKLGLEVLPLTSQEQEGNHTGFYGGYIRVIYGLVPQEWKMKKKMENELGAGFTSVMTTASTCRAPQ